MTKRPSVSLLLLATLPLLMAVPAAAAPAGPVAPGDRLVLDAPDDGGTEFQVGPVFTKVQEMRASYNPSSGTVSTQSGAFSLITGWFGLPKYSRAWLSKEFIVSGPPENTVRARVSVKYDFGSLFEGGGGYTVSGSLVLKVVDVLTGELVGEQTLQRWDRNSDQGFTDISGDAASHLLFDQWAAFEVLLKRGREYRVVFEAEAMIQVLLGLVGETFINVDGVWHEVVVELDEDEVELLAQHDEDISDQLAKHDEDISDQLAQHDEDISDQLAQHDEDISDQLATHDEDIKALLKELREGQLEIMRLLLTPPGQRSSDLVGDWPLHTPPGQGKK